MLKFLKSTIKLFKSQCPATKVILLIGIICLINTILSIFFSSTFASPADVAIRSVMSSIFGYILGDHCLPNNFGNNGIQVSIASIVALFCMAAIILLYWTDISQSSAAAVEIRNLLFSSVGFLISKAKGEENNSC
ncbi:hypothetical protein ACQPU1_13485 [Clostridium paraputrificum]|uniref:hypothetical protein n=1 Tax=Clostridium TaxID=1485 RepID=UPI003D356AEF